MYKRISIGLLLCAALLIGTSGQVQASSAASLPTPDGVALYRDTPFALTSGVGAFLPWERSERDNDGYWDSNNPLYVTIPADGYYSINAEFSTTPTWQPVYMQCALIFPSLAAVNAAAFGVDQHSGGAAWASSTVTRYFTAGDQIEYKVRADAIGSSVTVGRMVVKFLP